MFLAPTRFGDYQRHIPEAAVIYNL